MSKQTVDLLKLRGEEYGQAWKKTGLLTALVQEEYDNFARRCPEYTLPWTTILCKLLRALITPENVDHWQDIAGYATLVYNDLMMKRGNDGRNSG